MDRINALVEAKAGPLKHSVEKVYLFIYIYKTLSLVLSIYQ